MHSRAPGALVLGAVLLAAACAPPEGARDFDSLDEALADERAPAIILLDILPVETGPLRTVRHPDTGLLCARARFPKAATGEVTRALLEYGLDENRADPVSPPADCGFRRGAATRGLRLVNREGDETRPLHAVVAPGRFWFWWDGF